MDPGAAVVDPLAEVLAEHRLRPAAVLLTHGHLDHVFSVTPVCGAHGVASYIHGDDAYRLADPFAGLDPAVAHLFEQQFGAAATWAEPDDVRRLEGGEELAIAGLRLTVVHAPGHTEGSVMFTVPEPPIQVEAEVDSTVLSGDVLFAGGIGRTDLPGGSHTAMMRSLREKVLTLPDGALILPGHGPLTTMARERATNPYLSAVSGGVHQTPR